MTGIEPLDILTRVGNDLALIQERAPEGVSVKVIVPEGVAARLGSAELSESLAEVAAMIAAVQYPGLALTGAVLHVGAHEFGINEHEVILEVGERNRGIVISRSQNGR